MLSTLDNAHSDTGECLQHWIMLTVTLDNAHSDTGYNARNYTRKCWKILTATRKCLHATTEKSSQHWKMLTTSYQKMLTALDDAHNTT